MSAQTADMRTIDADAGGTTRLLLACGIVAGPMYVAVTLAEAFVRPGFDLRVHRFSWLTAGDLGWVHQANMVVAGTLCMLFALGLGRVVRAGPTAVWGARLLVLHGLVYVVGGLLKADGVAGFPPGIAAEAVQSTWQGAAQNASRGLGSLALVAATVCLALGLAATGRRALAWMLGLALPACFLGLTAVGLTIGGTPTALAFLVTPWAWLTALAAWVQVDGARAR